MNFQTDKFAHGLIAHYERILAPLKFQKIKLLEIGILGGGSLLYWANYFPDSTVVGIDLNLPSTVFPGNVSVHKCNQNDGESLERIAKSSGPFNIIIDDGAHFRKETENSFNSLWKYVSPGGFYVIEDWAVGYRRNSLQYKGMTEFITYLIENSPELNISASETIYSFGAAGNSIAIFKKGQS